MALSNWDAMAMNEEGAPIAARWRSRAGVEVEIYKNWIYVRDEKAWQKESQFIKPTVMHVTHGFLVYKDVNIASIRGPQMGIFAVVWSGASYAKPTDEDYEIRRVRGMAGCGVVAADDDGACVGLTPDTMKWWLDTLMRKERGDEVATDQWYWADVPDVFRAIDWSKALRYNQGDEFLADHGVGDGVHATPPGQAEPPLMSRMLEPRE